jgi:hypothetical protein
VGRADHGEEEVRGMDGVALGGGGGLADRGVGSTPNFDSDGPAPTPAVT